jgi:hypothetical protein
MFGNGKGTRVKKNEKTGYREPATALKTPAGSRVNHHKRLPGTEDLTLCEVGPDV